MRAVLTIAGLALREYSRRRLLIVTLLSMLLVAGTGLLSNPFTLGVQTRFMSDMALLYIQVFSVIFSLALAATVIPNEIERKTLQAFLAKPMSRVCYLWGKFLAIAALLAMNVFLLGAELFLILLVNRSNPHGIIFACCFLIVLESLVIAAFCLWFSIFSTAPVSFAAILLLFVIGSLTHVYTLILTTGNPIMRWLLMRLKSILPYFDYFSIRSAVVHNHPVSLVYLGMAAVYGVLYIFLAMLLAEVSFAWKDL